MAGRRLRPWIALNAVLAAYVMLYLWWPRPLLLAAAVDLVVLGVPGLAWLRLFGLSGAERAAAVLITVALSAAAGILALVGQMLLGVGATPLSHAAVLALITDVGLLVTWGRPWPLAPRPAAALGGVVLLPVALVLYVLLFLGATRFVPGIEDQDVEVQGTAYAIVRHGTPMMLHDRRLPYHFAHPHLLHWLSAEGLLLAGQVEALRPYHEAAREAEQWLAAPLRPGDAFPVYEGRPWEKVRITVHVTEVAGDRVSLDQPILVARPDGTGEVSRQPTRAQLLDRALLRSYQDVLMRTFEVLPVWPTRAVNLGLALLALFFLHELAARLSGDRLIALLVPLAYASVPEVIGRSCCAAYMTVTVVFLVAAGWWYVAPASCRPPAAEAAAVDCPRRSAWPWGVAFVAGALLALANHKAVVAVGAMVLAGGLAHWLCRRWRAGWREMLTSPVGWGFVAGTAAFWMYGLAIAPAAFIQDHLQHHFLDRVVHVDALRYVRAGVYPSLGSLWWHFLWDAGVALPLVGVAALAWLLGVRGGRRREVLALVLWALLVGVAFSLIDWRQTKHLMHLMPVLALAPAAAAGASRPGGRLVWAGLLVVSVALALVPTVDWMTRGFGSFKPAGGW